MAVSTPTIVAVLLIVILAFALLLWILDNVLKIGVGKAFCRTFFSKMHDVLSPSGFLGVVTKDSFLATKCEGGAIPV